jgi:NAD(P)-dependent dehydrogenase (short-subunit alcohol dehydrogenase family)
MSAPMPDLFSMRGKRALVVGGTRGIGKAIAARLAAAGAEVIATYVRDDAAAEQFATTSRDSEVAIEVLKADATSDKGREAMVTAVTNRFQDLSVLVYAAATGVHRPFDQLTGRYFDFTFALNVKAFLAVMQAFLPKLHAGSSVIALSSEGAERAISQYGLVGASKGALEALCRHAAVELAPKGIRINVLSPGTVRTDAWNSLPDADRRLAEAAAKTPRGMLTSLEEVAWAAQFLASDASAGLAGHTLVVDGAARVVGTA